MGHYTLGLVATLVAFVWRVLYVRRRNRQQARAFRKWYRDHGTPPERGSWVLSASTGTRERGTRTPGMGTTAECSFWLARGQALAGVSVQTWLRHASSYTAPGSSTGATATRGGNGERLEGAA